MDGTSVAVIPARGGSRRLPRKNILPFRGRPMIAWTIDAARESALFNEVVVTTEDEEIASVARDAGVDILDRPAELAKDDVPLVRVLLHALEALGVSDEADACLLMPNCPLRDARDIREVRDVHRARGSDVCMSIVSYDWRPPQWALQKVPSGWYRQAHGRCALQSVSKEDRWFAPTGAIRWVNARAFSAVTGFYPERLAGHELPWYRAIDIDEPEDMEMAECVAHALENGFRFSTQ